MASPVGKTSTVLSPRPVRPFTSKMRVQLLSGLVPVRSLLYPLCLLDLLSSNEIGRNLTDLKANFATVEACRAYLARLRWRDGFHWLSCGDGRS